MFDSQEIERLKNLPARPSNVSQLMENYDSEFAYIKSLNLPSTVDDIFKTLEKSLMKVSTLLNESSVQTESQTPEENRKPLSFNYEFLQNLTQ